MATPPQKIDFHQEIPASLLRQLAEAADGYRGKKFWFSFSVDDETLSNGQRGKFISRGHETSAAADGDLTGKPNRHRIGPFKTDTWAKTRNREISQLLVTTKKDGTPETPVDFKVHEHDALFWAEAAVDKFVIPYYVAIYDVEYGLTIKKAFNDPLVYALTHLPGSEYAGAVVPTRQTLQKLFETGEVGEAGELEVWPITLDWEAWWAARLAEIRDPARDTPEGGADAPSPAAAPEPPRNDSQV
jgi:hypothetical protein